MWDPVSRDSSIYGAPAAKSEIRCNRRQWAGPGAGYRGVDTLEIQKQIHREIHKEIHKEIQKGFGGNTMSITMGNTIKENCIECFIWTMK